MSKNKKEFDFLGITRFHEAGYKGQGITVASHERLIPGVFDDVFALEYGEKGNDYDEHGTLVMDYINQVVPEATKISVKTGLMFKNGKLAEWKAMDYLLENIPDFLGTANHSGNMEDPRRTVYYKELYDKGCFLVCSAGNKQEEINEICEGNLWKAIGACRYNSGNPRVESAYVDGEEMDYVSLHNLYSEYNNDYNKGTSFSYEIFMAMCALVQCFFKIKTGKKLTHEQLNNFVNDNCIDLEEPGHDIKTGHGLFILPDPDSIDIEKYTDAVKVVEEKEEEEVMELPEPKVEIVVEERYQYLKDIPEGEFHDVIEFMIENKYIFGVNSAENIEDTEVDLSLDMIRMFVINYRAGLYKARD